MPERRAIAPYFRTAEHATLSAMDPQPLDRITSSDVSNSARSGLRFDIEPRSMWVSDEELVEGRAFITVLDITGALPSHLSRLMNGTNLGKRVGWK